VPVIPEQRGVASAQPGLRLWEENCPSANPPAHERLRVALFLPDTVEPRGYSRGIVPSAETRSP